MKTRKILVAGLAGMMAVSVLGGCGKSTQVTGSGNTADTSAQADKTGENMEKTVIRFWGHQNEAWQIAYEDMIAKFEKAYPEYDIQSEYCMLCGEDGPWILEVPAPCQKCLKA